MRLQIRIIRLKNSRVVTLIEECAGAACQLFQHGGGWRRPLKAQAGNKMHDEEYLTPEEASRYLRLSLGSVYKLIGQSELGASKKGHYWLIRRSELEEFSENLGEREEFPIKK
jgi:excisionase family DNA binding protein